MSILEILKEITLKRGDEYLRKCLVLVDSYIDKHSAALLNIAINDSYVEVCDGRVLLLKINTAMLNSHEEN